MLIEDNTGGKLLRPDDADREDGGVTLAGCPRSCVGDGGDKLDPVDASE
eukprot:COSAG02_NODE_1433_length_12638_cov_10.941388_6_plen_49_part_00